MTNTWKNKRLQKFYGIVIPSGCDLHASFISEETYERLMEHDSVCAFCVEAEKEEDINLEWIAEQYENKFDYKGRDLQNLPTFRSRHFVEIFKKDGELKARPISSDEFYILRKMHGAVFCEEAPRYSDIDFDYLRVKAERLNWFIVEE